MRRRLLNTFGRDERGVAAIEVALVGTLLAGALVNVAEVSRYAYLSMEVNAAAQAGAQAAVTTCNPSQTPVTINCDELEGAIETAIAGTSLGDEVSLEGPVSEGWYCLDEEGALHRVSDADNKPADCADAGDPEGRPALYVRLQTTYTFEPMFPGLTLVQAFSDTIDRSAMMRVL